MTNLLRSIRKRTQWIRRSLGALAGERPSIDVEVGFRSLAAWRAWSDANPGQFAKAEVEAIVRHACAFGVESPFLGFVEPRRVWVEGGNYRESLVAAGLNPRQRVVLDRLSELPGAHDIWKFRVYGHEALTPVAMQLRGRYARYLGSEFAENDEGARALFPIPAIDISRSGLPDASFEAIVSNDVLEHVADLDGALRDSARILKAGGLLIATFPFIHSNPTTEVRAVLEGSSVRHVGPPEYHGNPVDPEGGSLVFQVPGWDILERARSAGFADASMVYASSRRRGYTGAEIAGIFRLEARR